MTTRFVYPQTLPGALAAAASQRGPAPFLIQGDEEMSYADLDASSRQVAAGLAGLGIGRGDRVGLLSLNCVEWVVLFFACARLGAVAVGMSPRYRGAELGYMLRDSEVVASLLPKGTKTSAWTNWGATPNPWTDPQPLDGTHYYYLRVLQTDGEIAWSSPIWVTRK